MKRATGFREWAKYSANAVLGCEHDCRYGWCRALAHRYGWLRQIGVNAQGQQTMIERPWNQSVVNPRALAKRRKKLDGVVAFPTMHDITPATLEPCTQVLLNILRAGNRVLITTKPHLAVVENLCRVLEPWRAQIMWRMTITADNDAVLSYWEPGAPSYRERHRALTHAFLKGFRTSVSIEPMLDPLNVVRLVVDLTTPIVDDWLYGVVTDTIWIGMMNYPRQRVRVRTDFDRIMLDDLIYDQREENIRAIYAELKDCPFIRWKESIKEVVGLPPATEPERWSSIAKEERP